MYRGHLPSRRLVAMAGLPSLRTRRPEANSLESSPVRVYVIASPGSSIKGNYTERGHTVRAVARIFTLLPRQAWHCCSRENCWVNCASYSVFSRLPVGVTGWTGSSLHHLPPAV